MTIAELFDVSGNWLYLCCGICLIPGLFLLFCFIMAVLTVNRIGVFRNVAGNPNLLLGFWKMIALVVIIVGMTLIAAIDYGLMILFNHGYRLSKNWLLEKRPEDGMVNRRLTVGPDSRVFVLEDHEYYKGGPILRVYDKASKYVDSYQVREYVNRIVDNERYREILLMDNAIDVHDIDAAQDGGLIILASVPRPDGNNVKFPDEDDYDLYDYEGPRNSIILTISPSGELIGTLWLNDDIGMSNPRTISTRGNDILLGGTGRIFKLDKGGNVMAFYDLPANADKVFGSIRVYAADDAVVACRAPRDVFILTKELKPVQQWGANFLCQKDETVTGIIMDEKGNVVTIQSNSSLMPVSRYTAEGKFKGRIGNMLFGFQAMDALDIDIDGTGRIYLLNDVFNEIFVYCRK